MNATSRWLGAGSGTVAGGRAGLAIDRRLLGRLAADRPLALVSGTNGKTTTTRLLVAAAEEGLGTPVVTNATGSNMPPGHVAAMAGAPGGWPAVLEVDEGYLPRLVRSLSPAVVVLLNLSRDQLDRTNEVRMVAGRWRDALAVAGTTTVVANADDPLVTWGAGSARHRVWVGAGAGWRLDAVGCPACAGRIDFTAGGPAGGPVDRPGAQGGRTARSGAWRCACGFSRPALDVRLDTDGDRTDAVWADGRRLGVRLAVPGSFNRANAVMAAAAAEALGVPADRALQAMERVREVAGRFAVREVAGVATRLMLAKNPAGWFELLELVCPGTSPVVVAINARVADGRDPSWLWDVPFERLAGRPVVATGRRCRDLAVRLRYAEVPHRTLDDPVAAVEVAGTMGEPGSPVEFIGNYTAFHDVAARR